MREEGKRRQEPQLGPRMALAASPPRIGDNRITRKFWHRKRPASLLPLDCDSCNARQGGRDKAHITQEEVPKGSPFYAFIIRAEKPSLMTDLELDCGTQPHGKWDNRQPTKSSHSPQHLRLAVSLLYFVHKTRTNGWRRLLYDGATHATPLHEEHIKKRHEQCGVTSAPTRNKKKNRRRENIISSHSSYSSAECVHGQKPFVL